MTGFLWVIQFFLAVDTLMGALWKFSNSEQDIPALEVIPHSVWLGLSLVEIACTVALILPLLKFMKKQETNWASIAALLIAAEMIIYSVLHIHSGDPNNGPMIYWLVVAGICIFLATARFKYARSL